MVYQPKVEANSLQLVGVESLLRWRKPDGSLIGPGAVIPTAEANDLIYPHQQFCAKALPSKASGAATFTSRCRLTFLWMTWCNLISWRF